MTVWVALVQEAPNTDTGVQRENSFIFQNLAEVQTPGPCRPDTGTFQVNTQATTHHIQVLTPPRLLRSPGSPRPGVGAGLGAARAHSSLMTTVRKVLLCFVFVHLHPVPGPALDVTCPFQSWSSSSALNWPPLTSWSAPAPLISTSPIAQVPSSWDQPSLWPSLQLSGSFPTHSGATHNPCRAGQLSSPQHPSQTPQTFSSSCH